MISRLKKAILRRARSIKRPNLHVPKDISGTLRTITDNDTSYGSNEYIYQNFFDGENYVSIIKCLDGGYQVCNDLLEYMDEHCNILKNTMNHFNSYSKQWRSTIKQRSRISSYHTTKRAQLQVIATPAHHAELLKQRCDTIQQVINTYRTQIRRMYPSERLGIVHKHYRTDAMKQLFKDARASLISISNTLDQLRRDEERAEKVLHDADIQCENLRLDPTAVDSKVTHANNNLRKANSKLDQIRKEIAHTLERQEQEENNYRKTAIDIYEQCRKLEQERLDLIGDTLIKFVEAAYSDEYSKRYNEIYENLMSNINTERNTMDDLDFWAKTYHVYSSTTSVSSDTNSIRRIGSDEAIGSRQKSQNEETRNVITADENIEQSIGEIDGERSLADTITSTKSKSKKNKNSTSIDKQNTNTTEKTRR